MFYFLEIGAFALRSYLVHKSEWTQFERFIFVRSKKHIEEQAKVGFLIKQLHQKYIKEEVYTCCNK